MQSQDDSVDELVQIIYQEIFGQGIIDTLVDSELDEIGVTRDDYVWVQDGGIKRRITNLKFKSKEDLLNIISNRTSSYNKPHDVNPQKPHLLGGRRDGSRVNICVNPLSKHPVLNIRKFILKNLTDDEIKEKSGATDEFLEVLKRLYKGRPNYLVIGEQSAGKSTMLKYLCRYIDDNLGIGTIERAFELNLDDQYPDKNIISLQEAAGFDVEALFQIMLKQNRDIIMVGEISSPADAMVTLKAMLRQAKGSSGSFHSNSPENTMYDIRNLLMQSGYYTNEMIALFDVARAIDVIIQIRPDRKTGFRYIRKVSEIIEDRKTMNFEESVLFKLDKKTKKLKPTGNKLSDNLVEKLLDYEATEEDIKVINAILSGEGVV
nr:ATPase, T2SS/T4P/T4SS family [Tissierella carlieri]